MGHDDGDPEVDLPIDPDLETEERAPGHRIGRAPIDVLAAIAAGGALGAPARYEMTRLIHVAKGTFPWATFWTNITGSLVLGFLLVLLIERYPPSRYLRPFFATGFLGAYTTFSTYMVDTATLVKDEHTAIGVTYLLFSALAGFAAVWIGIIAGRQVPSRVAERPAAEDR
jgi:fluoride exporter